MRRAAPGFVDFGRWTARTWTTKTPGVWLAVGYTYRGNERPYGIGGPAITFGRRTWAVFALCSRAEHKARKHDPWATESEEFQPLPRHRRGLGRLRWWR
ncbi:hypothetical protein [Streptomyces flavofungini]|uniref:hypothetical protein n=1 Tax=Streptomyces flavofungini TaxID=68200 RepID=UPI0025B1C6D7|nr:hypothetical protein [Streptomyces flavofungini]WJV44543.1 hypothetical protein QUY26_02750 [Streptomyces flavofungini]